MQTSIYDRKDSYLPKILGSPNVLPEDKQKIRELLKKPWNPYIRRHSALTEKSTSLKAHVLRQHAGWSGRSQMHLKYIHYFGNESSESILEAYGIVTKDKEKPALLKPKQCPNCNEPNKPNSRFCGKCRMVLTYDAYETLESQKEKESEVQVLKENSSIWGSSIKIYIKAIGCRLKATSEEKIIVTLKVLQKLSFSGEPSIEDRLVADSAAY